MPRTHMWNLSVERQMFWNSTLRLTYSGAKGFGLLRYVPENLAVTPAEGGIVVVDHPNNAPAAGYPDLRGHQDRPVASDYACAGTGTLPNINPNAACPNKVPIANNEISLRVPRTNERRPDPNYTTNSIISNDAESWYHGCRSSGTRRSATAVVQRDVHVEQGDRQHLGGDVRGTGDTKRPRPGQGLRPGALALPHPAPLTFNGTWRMPFFRGRTDWVGDVLGGWDLSAIIKIIHGTPFTVTDTGGGDITWDGFSENRPVILDPSILGTTIDDSVNSQQQLPSSAFRRATPSDYKLLVGRNTFYGDGSATWTPRSPSTSGCR